MNRIIIAALVLAWVAIPAAARSREVNAATWYRRAQERLAGVPQESLQALFDFGTPGGPTSLTAEQRELLARLQPAIALARQGSKQEFSDFELDYSEGVELKLPHINQIRNMAKLMRADAAIRMSEGDSAGAAEDFASMYRMAGHCSGDGIIISSLVGQAIFTLANSAAQAGLDQGAFAPEDAAKMMLSLQRIPGSDPFDYVEAIVNEQETMMNWVREKLQEEDGAARFVETWGLKEDDPKAAAIMALTPDEFEADVSELDAIVDRVVGIFLLNDAEQARVQMQDLEKEFDEGAGGILLSIGFVPAYGKVLERKLEVEEALATRIKLLKGLVSGETTPEEAANAALWYLQGIEMLRELGTEKLQQVTAAAADPAARIDEPVAAILKDAVAIVDVFRAASLKKRCDFRVAGPARQRVLRDYMGGMRAAARLLHADAIRCEHAVETDSLVDRLSICFRMSAHLAGDGAMIGALASHRIFEASTSLIPVKEKACTLSTDQQKVLLKAVESASRKDPFQYIESLANERALLKEWIKQAASKSRNEAEAARAAAAQQQAKGGPAAASPPGPAPGGAAQPTSAHPTPASADPAKVIDGWDAERVLAMEFVLESLLSADAGAPGSAAEPETRALGELDDVVASGAIAAVREQGAIIKSDLAADAFAQLSGRAFEPIAPIVKRMTEARQDLRRTAILLQPRLSLPEQPPVNPVRDMER